MSQIKCSQCKQIKESTEFYKDLTKRNLLNNKCKECCKHIEHIYYKTKGSKYREDGKTKITCETCGKTYTKSNKTKHLKTLYHSNSSDSDSSSN